MFNDVESKLLLELQKEQYGLRTSDIARIHAIHKHRNFFDVSDQKNECCKVILISDSNIDFEFKLKTASQVVDVPPLIIDNSFVKVYPAIVLFYPNKADGGFVNFLMHELCHLYAIGDFKQTGVSETSFLHKSGINNYIYHFSSSASYKETIFEDYDLNEQFNNFVTSFLLEAICSKRYFSCEKSKRFAQRIYRIASDLDIDIVQLVGLYFKDSTELLDIIRKYF